MPELFPSPFVVNTVQDNTENSESQLKPLSHARLTANRENAKLSSGPTSPEGKQIVSRNSTVHGLSGKFRVLPSETQSEFDDLLSHLLKSHAAANEAETELITSMAESLWMARRAARLQDRCIEAIESGDIEIAKTARQDLALYLRYQTTHERSYQRYAAELRKLQDERRKTEIGFVSQKHREADQQRKQERHEGMLTYTKSRAEHQLMKNHLLAANVRKHDQDEERMCKILQGEYRK
jgi:hypothetical protein